MRKTRGLPVIVVGMILLLATPCALADALVWTENGSIYRADLDGSEKQRVFQARASTRAATGLAYDSTTGKLYWDGRSDPSSQVAGHGIIRRMRLDGSGLEKLIDSGVGTITFGFALSTLLNCIYIGEHKTMRFANLDGTALTTLPLQPRYDSVIRIDEPNRKLYFNDGEIYYGIRRANLDGSGLENIYHGHVACFDLDLRKKQIYVGSDKDIRRVNLDGSNPQVLIPAVSHLISIQLDHSGKAIYWMTNTHIVRSDQNGSNIQAIIRLGQTAKIVKDDMIIIVPGPPDNAIEQTRSAPNLPRPLPDVRS